MNPFGNLKGVTRIKMQKSVKKKKKNPIPRIQLLTWKKVVRRRLRTPLSTPIAVSLVTERITSARIHLISSTFSCLKLLFSKSKLSQFKFQYKRLVL